MRALSFSIKLPSISGFLTRIRSDELPEPPPGWAYVVDTSTTPYTYEINDDGFFVIAQIET